MSSVLFYTRCFFSGQPYDTGTLHTCALGGNRGDLTRVADALEAFVIQHNRAEDWPASPPQRIPLTHVIVNRDSRRAAAGGQALPRARTYCGWHDQ